MKTLFTIFILTLVTVNESFAGQFKSIQSGNYDAVSTWTLVGGEDPDGKPDYTDTVTIRSGHTVVIAPSSGGNAAAYVFDVQAGGIFYAYGRVFSVYTSLTQSGIIYGPIQLQILRDCIFSTPSTTYTGKGSIGVFYGKTLTIAAGSSINIQGYIEVVTGTFGGPGKVINKGSVNLLSAYAIEGTVKLTAPSSKWINDGAGTLTMSSPASNDPTANMDFTGTGSSVTYTLGSNYIIPGNYYNLNVNSSTAKTLTGNLLVANNLTTNGLSTNSVNLNGNQLTLKGNATINGFYNSCVINGSVAGSKILFNGTSPQTLSGTGTFSVQLLDVNTTSNVTLNTSLNNTVFNTLKITDANFNPNGKLVLYSNSSTTARIDAITTGTISGAIVMEKFFPQKASFWYDMSSPSQGSVVMDWDDELYISGIGSYDGIGGPAGVDGDVLSTTNTQFNYVHSMNIYDESIYNYSYVSGSNTPLTPGTGYNLWFEDLTDNISDAKKINTIGVPNQGDLTLNLSFTYGAAAAYSGTVYPAFSPDDDGYHLIGNPYASAIDVNYIYNNGNYTDMNTSYVQTLDGKATGNFVDVLATANGIIYPHQGFWVQVDPFASVTQGTIKFTESCKVTNVNTANSRLASNYDIKLVLTSPTNGFYHENTINFNNQATLAYDKNLDSKFRFSTIKGALSLFMLDENGKKMMGNDINSTSDEITIPLGMVIPKSGTYYIDASILNMDSYNYAWLENIKTGQQFDLNKNGIPIEGAENSINKDYVLRLSKTKKSSSIAETILETDLMVFNTEGNVNLKSTNSSHLLTIVNIFDMSGKLVLSQSNVTVEVGNTVKIDITALANGVYVVNVLDEEGRSLSKKLVK